MKKQLFILIGLLFLLPLAKGSENGNHSAPLRCHEGQPTELRSTNVWIDSFDLPNSQFTDDGFEPDDRRLAVSSSHGGVSPNLSDNTSLRYDQETNVDAVGLSAGGTFTALVRFPAATMQQYVGMGLEQVEIFIHDLPGSCIIKIWDGGTETSPGAIIHQQAVIATTQSWLLVDISSLQIITGNDLWVGYEVTHSAGMFPAGVGPGPAVVGYGDWINFGGNNYYSISTGYGLDYNWNIAIFLTQSEEPIVNAGNNNTVCEGEPVPLNGQAENYSYVLWTTTGDGDFENENELNTVYNPGVLDYALGEATLCLTAFPEQGSGFEPSTHCMIATFQKGPSVNILPETYTICEGEFMDFTGLINAQRYSEILWFSLDGTGYFVDEWLLESIYIPSEYDIIEGCIELGVLAFAFEPCYDVAIDFMTLCFQRAPVANAGADATICQGDSYELLDASASNYELLLWTSFFGSGSFSNENDLNPTYFPSLMDWMLGSIEICLSAAPIDPCSPGVSDCMTLTFLPKPFAFAGNDATICFNGELELSNASAGNYSGLYWTGGDGIFLPSNTTLKPTYYPGEDDIANGGVQICLTAMDGDCDDAVDCFYLTVISLPVINCEDIEVCITDEPFEYLGIFLDPALLGPGVHSFTIIEETPCAIVECTFYVSVIPEPYISIIPDTYLLCESNVMNFAGHVTGSNYSSLQWFTLEGTGYFEPSENVLEPVYYHSAIDIEFGCITIGLVAEPLNPCSVYTEDFMLLCIQPMPVANAGGDDTICEGDTYDFSKATASNYSEIIWTSLTPGEFINPNDLNPIYIPSFIDLLLGYAELCMNLAPIYPCDVGVTDCMTLYIQPKPLVDAGVDITVGAVELIQLSGAAENYSGLEWYTTNGNGTLMYANTLSPIYYPDPSGEVNDVIEFCLIAYGIEPCDDAEDCMLATIVHYPTVFAGQDDIICCGDEYPLDGAQASDYSFLQWTTSGNGSFSSNEFELNPTYIPSEEDCVNGYVVLCLTAYSLQPLNTSVTHCMTLTIQMPPAVVAGEDATYCCNSYTLGNSAAEYYSSLLWTTTGDGDFSSPTILHPDYYPGPADRAAGIVTLCLTAYPISPCDVEVIHCFTLVILPYPTANAGGDKTVCGCEPLTITQAEATHYSELAWEIITGDGQLDGYDMLHPTYSPTPSDCERGYVKLCLTSWGIYPCMKTSTDCMFIYFFDLPEVTCPGNLEFCVDDGIIELIASPLGGDFEGNGISGNDFDPDAAQPGIHSITYTYEDDNGCINSCTFTITVHPLPMVECPDDFVKCIDDPDFELPQANPQGGSYYINGAEITVFSPSEAGIGQHIVNYYITDFNTGCTNSCTFTITVHPLPEVTCPGNFEVCISDEPFELTGAYPIGGIYSNTYIIDGIFYPGEAGPGVHTITYTYFYPETNCANFCTFTITVVEITATVVVPDLTFCFNQPVVTIPLSYSNGYCGVKKVSWYIKSCDVNDWIEYQVTTSIDDLLFLPYELYRRFSPAPECLHIKTVLELICGVCGLQTIESNIGTIYLCKPLQISITSDGPQSAGEYCGAMTPALLTATIGMDPPDVPECDYFSIKWYYKNELVSEDLPYQPPLLDFEGEDDDCYTDHTFIVEAENVCGKSSASRTIRIYNPDAPIGILEIAPQEDYPQPFCYGEDVTLRYAYACAGEPATWTWHYTTVDPPATTDYMPIPNSGDQNSVYNTNKLYQTTWYMITKQNGVCDPEYLQLKVQIKQPVAIINFEAVPDPCREQYVMLTLEYEPPMLGEECHYNIDWYRNGSLIHTSTSLSSPAAYTYTISGSVAGNYYAVIKDNCCPQYAETPVLHIEPSCIPVIEGTCFRCYGDPSPIVLTASMVLPPNYPCPCTNVSYQWFKDGVLIPNATDATFISPDAGTFEVESTCMKDGVACVKNATHSVYQCTEPCRFGEKEPNMVDNAVIIKTMEESFLGDELMQTESFSPNDLFMVYPNPTYGLLTVEFNHLPPASENSMITIEIFDMIGSIVLKEELPFQQKHLLNFEQHQPGFYIIKVMMNELVGTRKIIKR